jgi:hypothetical protein
MPIIIRLPIFQAYDYNEVLRTSAMREFRVIVDFMKKEKTTVPFHHIYSVHLNSFQTRGTASRI